MRIFVVPILIAFLVLSSCSSGPSERVSKRPHLKPTQTEQPAHLQEKAPRQQRKTSSAQAPRKMPADQETKLILPTRIHAADGAQMVLVNHVAGIGVVGPSHDTPQAHGPAKSPSGTGAFYIDQMEVTVAKYKKINPKYDETPYTRKGGCPSCPAMGIDWSSADGYCRSMGKRLPTEAEWETAARGPAYYRLPWGNQFDPKRANLVGNKDGFLSAAPVGSFPPGTSPYGAMDMIGNVWEWVGTPHSPLPASPVPKKDKILRLAKGGGWTSPPERAAIDYRNVVNGTMKNPTFGFRCVKQMR